MNYLALDISLSSPGVVLYSNNIYKLYFLPQRKKEINFYKKINDSFEIKAFDIMKDNQQQYIVDNILALIKNIPPKDLAIGVEDYAYNAQGRGLTQVHEITGIILYELSKLGYSYKKYGIGTIKKNFTDSGNSNKFMMSEYFKFKYGFDIHDILSIKKSKTIKKPVEDLVDAVAIIDLLLNKKNIIPQKKVITNLTDMI